MVKAKVQAWQEATKLAAAMKPEIEALERRRKGHLLFLILISLLAGIVLYIAACVVFQKPFLGLNGVPCFIGLTGALAMGIASYPAFDHDYRKTAKRHFMPRLAKEMKMTYRPYGNFAVGQVYDHYLFPSYSRHKTEDGFSGELSDRRVQIQEVFFQRRAANKGFGILDFSHMPWREKGLVIHIEMRTSQPFHTLIYPKTFFGRFLHKEQFQGIRHYQRTPFGPSPMKNNYIVLSEEPTDAHDIFSPDFIETFLALRRHLGIQRFYASFKKSDAVFYARHARNMFEPGHLTDPVNINSLRDILEEVAHLRKLIDLLKLNPYVGL